MRKQQLLLRTLCGFVGMMLVIAPTLSFAQDAEESKDSAWDEQLEDSIEGSSEPVIEEIDLDDVDDIEIEPIEGSGDGIRLNFRGVPLDTVLDYLSKAAGFVIIKTIELTGTVDVWSHQPLSKDEAVDLLNAILINQGYAAIRNGRMLTIVSLDEAKQHNIPVRKGSDPKAIPMNDEMVTQVIPVRHADAKQLVENITPLLPTYATAAFNESSNTVILTDTQSNIRRMVEIIQALDTAISEVSSVKVYKLENSDPTETANIINQVFSSDGSGQGGRNDRRRRMAEFFMRRGGRGRGMR